MEKYTKEIEKLAGLLVENGVDFRIRKTTDVVGEQIIIYDAEGYRNGDVAINKYTYGNKDGLLEYMGDGVPEDNGDEVIGCLTAEQALTLVMDGLANAW